MAKKPLKPNPSPMLASAPVGATVAAPQPASEPFGKFFQLEDWIAAGATFLISGLAFLYFMSPEVTLQDSGELVTGAFNFGVPHPPGYPLWAFLAWVWRHLVPFGNPAWRICLFSVLTGALVVGVTTLLMTRSTLMLLRALSWADPIDEKMKHWISLTVGAALALTFGFNRGVWLWACVPEMRVLNEFMFTLMTCTFFAWMMRPDRHWYLFVTILVYALGIANHQTVVVMAAPFMVGAMAVGILSIWDKRPWSMNILMPALSAFWELVVAALFGLAVGAYVAAWLQTPDNGQVMAQTVSLLILFGPQVPVALLVFLPIAAAVLMLIWFGTEKWLNRRTALICTAMFLLGCAFYLYMPLAAVTNPPMNWGFTATKQGFLHHITRGQYERLNMSLPWTRDFWIQVGLFIRALLQQFSPPLKMEYDYLLGLPIAGFALLTFGVLTSSWECLRPRGRVWLIFVWAAFVITSLGLVTIINPGLDKQNQEITIKFFAPAHGFFAILGGYGIAMAVAWVLVKWKEIPPMVIRLACVGLLALPLVSYRRNKHLCDIRGHDFGYQFGYRMFYPGGDYPPMEKDAVLFGGTDPGRFVPTYMIFCESRVAPQDRYSDPHLDPEGGKKFDRRDVYIITQNALADNTYMSYIRDHYDFSRPCVTNPATLAKFEPWQQWVFRTGWKSLHRDTMYPKEPIWIPTEQDLQRAFQEYVSTIKGRQLGPEEDVDIDPAGRVSVRGVGGVMAINGILTKWIFDHAKDKHAFYVEESYVIPWMYPYLTPAGIIMKINKDPLPSPEQAPDVWKKIVTRDTAYWDKLVADFMGVEGDPKHPGRPEFLRDTDAQKTFSKLRSAIGGIYAYRHMLPQAEYAYKQARKLCKESPEANFRLAQLYMEQNRIDDAIAVLSDLLDRDPLNRKIADALAQLQAVKDSRGQAQQLEKAVAKSPRSVTNIIKLAQTYALAGQHEKIQPLCDKYLAQPDLPADEMIQIAQLYIQLQRGDLAVRTLEFIVTKHPDDSQSYYALAIIRGAMGGTNEALDNLARAIALTPALRNQAQVDRRLAPIRKNPRFAQIVAAPPVEKEAEHPVSPDETE